MTVPKTCYAKSGEISIAYQVVGEGPFDLVFVPGPDGILHAYNAENGQELWSHNNGLGHVGGIISYSAGGKQYIAVATGWGSLVGDDYGAVFGEPWKSMPKDAGAMIVFALK